MRGPSRRAVVLGVAAAPFLACAARAQAPGAAAWPAITKIVVPFPPGGSVDAIARLLQVGLQERLGTNLVIENKSGASGSIGAAQVAKSPADGATWLFVFDTHAVNPALQPNMPFDSSRDLDPVMLIGTAPNVIAAHPSRPYRTLAEAVAAAKAKPDGLSFASIGNGSLGHLTMVVLAKRAGIRWTHVPYRGGGPALNDAVAGHVDMIIGSAALVTPQINAGALRAIGQTGAKRMPTLPDTPTAIESGFAGFESYAWWGVFAPAGTPKPMVERFIAALTAALREERIAKQLGETQQVDLRLGGPDELRRFFAEQMRVWGEVVRDNGIKADG